MIEFTDPFGRMTILEILISNHNKRVGFVIRKERQSFYESWDLKTVNALVDELQTTIRILEENV